MIDKRDISTLSDPQLLALRQRHIDRLKRLFAGKDDSAVAFALCGVPYRLDGVRAGDIELQVANALKELASHADMLQDGVVFRPPAMDCCVYGVHFVDKMFGGDVFDLDGAWQVNALAQPVGRLEGPDLDTDPTWRKAREIAEAFIAASVTVPFFGLPTIASALNVGVNLFGQELLVAMMAEPAAAHHDLGVINQTLCKLHRWYLDKIPAAQLQPVVAAYRTQPPGFGQLCGCTTQLISRELYREFVAPLDARLLGTYPNGGMIHLCGSHVQHIETWRQMKELRSVQLNDLAADHLDKYWTGLRDDQILYVNPTAYMNLERIMSLTNGHRVVIVGDVQDKDMKHIQKRSGP